MFRRMLLAVAAAIALTIGSFAAAAPANADGGVWYDPSTGNTYLVITQPPSDPPYSPDENGWTAGAPSCMLLTTQERAQALGPGPVRLLNPGTPAARWYVITDCGNGRMYWSNDRQCYISMVDGQWPARPGGMSQEAGYYVCNVPAEAPSGARQTYFWSESIPPGLTVLTPGAAAKKLIESFQLRGIDIGMAPEVNPAWGHRRSYVGVPIWLWVNNPQPLTWGPYQETATLGGQTITATAQVTSVIWNMGDGSSTVCGGTGTPYNAALGLQPSPTCGYRYSTTSKSHAGDRFNITATSQWTVTWTSLAGPGGTINLTTASADQLQVNELQTVIVPNNSTDSSGGQP
jgi:hypothetical protein